MVCGVVCGFLEGEFGLDEFGHFGEGELEVFGGGRIGGFAEVGEVVPGGIFFWCPGEFVGEFFAVGGDDEFAAGGLADHEGDFAVGNFVGAVDVHAVGAEAVAGAVGESHGGCNFGEGFGEEVFVDGFGGIGGAGEIPGAFGMADAKPGAMCVDGFLEGGVDFAKAVGAFFGFGAVEEKVAGVDVARVVGGFGVGAEAEDFVGALANHGFEEELPAEDFAVGCLE